jgi:ABC-type Fe3+-hydroxamate transport system substrate-binding protein
VRIVSLVPSLTELVLDLGLDKELVGRTKFCIHPKDKIQSIPKIGGTKNANISAIFKLKPDLILANKEENTREDIEALLTSQKVYVSEISNFKEALQTIQKIGVLTNREQASENLIQKIDSEFSTLSIVSLTKKKVCYLIWNDPIMTIGQDTYIHDMLQKCGLENIFADHKRYPSVDVEEIRNKKPDYIFLSSEPFPFKNKHIEGFKTKFPNSKIVLVDGEYFSWYGSRMVLAANYFKDLILGLV